MPRFEVPKSGVIDYQYETITIDVPTDKWLRAAVVLPGNASVVHHVLVFPGTLLDVVLSGGGLGGYFAAYVPGMKPVTFPEGTAKLLTANSPVTFQMHYTPSGTAVTDETKLGLYFAKEPPKSQLFTTAAANWQFNIPAGAPDHETQASVVPSATKDFFVHELSPHMHYRGSRFRFEALLPDKTTEIILSVPKYEFHWQTLYRLAEPKRFPAGTKIICRGAFDNSPQNIFNPNPKASVRFGQQSHEEMFIGYLNYSEAD